ncbi:MAG: HAD hydrolase-like protein [Methanomassiliicoccaceae archaeon]|nr:HAD hydrolase-like protein [Methanomassiliicoccaceae archaeon]
MKYNVIIFDLDGTLIDSSEGIVNSAERTICELGYPEIPREEIRSYIGPPIGNSIIARNGLGDEELKRFNSVFREIYKNEHLMEAYVYPGVMELLSDLRDVSFVAIATNKRIDYTMTLLDNMRISPLCDEIQGLDMESRLKKKDLVENCIKASGTKDRSGVVVVGDGETDASAARECGVDFIGVLFGFGFKVKEDVTYGRTAEDVQSLRDILFS